MSRLGSTVFPNTLYSWMSNRATGAVVGAADAAFAAADAAVVPADTPVGATPVGGAER